jgi:hypothetical protein
MYFKKLLILAVDSNYYVMFFKGQNSFSIWYTFFCSHTTFERGTPLISDTREAKTGGHGVQGQLGQHSESPSPFFYGAGVLNSGFCSCKAGTLPLEPNLQSESPSQKEFIVA